MFVLVTCVSHSRAIVSLGADISAALFDCTIDFVNKFKQKYYHFPILPICPGHRAVMRHPAVNLRFTNSVNLVNSLL